MVVIKMDEHEKLVKQLQDQIFITGSQIKQRMKTIQIDLLSEFGEDTNGHEHKPTNGDSLL